MCSSCSIHLATAVTVCYALNRYHYKQAPTKDVLYAVFVCRVVGVRRTGCNDFWAAPCQPAGFSYYSTGISYRVWYWVDLFETPSIHYWMLICSRCTLLWPPSLSAQSSDHAMQKKRKLKCNFGSTLKPTALYLATMLCYAMLFYQLQFYNRQWRIGDFSFISRPILNFPNFSIF